VALRQASQILRRTGELQERRSSALRMLAFTVARALKRRQAAGPVDSIVKMEWR
jgi:hypothetical protein